jgi:predicted SprT family Zn-dependent metalloprotease
MPYFQYNCECGAYKILWDWRYDEAEKRVLQCKKCGKDMPCQVIAMRVPVGTK